MSTVNTVSELNGIYECMDGDKVKIIGDYLPFLQKQEKTETGVILYVEKVNFLSFVLSILFLFLNNKKEPSDSEKEELKTLETLENYNENNLGLPKFGANRTMRHIYDFNKESIDYWYLSQGCVFERYETNGYFTIEFVIFILSTVFNFRLGAFGSEKQGFNLEYFVVDDLTGILIEDRLFNFLYDQCATKRNPRTLLLSALSTVCSTRRLRTIFFEEIVDKILNKDIDFDGLEIYMKVRRVFSTNEYFYLIHLFKMNQ